MATLLLAGCSLALDFESVPEGSGGKAGAATTGGSGGTSAPAGGGGSTASGTTSSTFTDPPSCTKDGECDSGKPCQTHTCQNGTCHHDAKADGNLPDDDLFDCRRPVCKAGEMDTEIDPTQDPDQDPNDCVNTYCLENGEPQSDPANEGQFCGAPPPSFCQETVCENKACVLKNKNEGEVVEQGDDLDCRDTKCQGGTPVQMPNYLNCPDASPNNCNIATCSAQGQCGGGAIAPAGTPCKTQNGQSGTCDGQGAQGANCQP